MSATTRSYPGRRPVSETRAWSLPGALLLLAGTLALASCSTDFADDEAREHQTISIMPGAANPSENQSFSPNPVTVLEKTEVLWTNDDSVNHQIASVSGLFQAETPIPPGGEYRHLFNERGNFRYYCTIPGHREEGVINVLP